MTEEQQKVDEYFGFFDEEEIPLEKYIPIREEIIDPEQ